MNDRLTLIMDLLVLVIQSAILFMSLLDNM